MKQTKGFILDAVSDSYYYPVVVELVDEDGNKNRFSFDAKFLRLDTDEQKDILNPPEGQTVPNDKDLLKRVLVGWRGVRLASGDEVPFSPEARERLLAISPTPGCIVIAWMKSIGIDAKVKN